MDSGEGSRDRLRWAAPLGVGLLLGAGLALYGGLGWEVRVLSSATVATLAQGGAPYLHADFGQDLLGFGQDLLNGRFVECVYRGSHEENCRAMRPFFQLTDGWLLNVIPAQAGTQCTPASRE